MQIHQINCQYLPTEDRILLRINTSENLEHQYLITRRYLKLILKALTSFFEEQDKASEAIAPPDVQRAISEFKHEQAVQQADMQKAYEEKPKANVAELLFSLQVKMEKGKRLILGLYTQKKQGMELAMPTEMAHSFFHLLSKTVIAAEWDMDLYFPPDSLLATATKPTLH